METKQKNKWLDLTVKILSLLSSVAVIVFAVLQISGAWEDAIDIVVPLLGLSNLCQVYTYWEKSRKVAYFSLATSIIIFACSVAVFLLK